MRRGYLSFFFAAIVGTLLVHFLAPSIAYLPAGGKGDNPPSRAPLLTSLYYLI